MMSGEAMRICQLYVYTCICRTESSLPEGMHVLHRTENDCKDIDWPIKRRLERKRESELVW
uniref:Transposase n=1 Tax=Heterorhabditis bacteriophora TaxID=37862 RepID=A0A1I7XSY9_HETBA